MQPYINPFCRSDVRVSSIFRLATTFLLVTAQPLHAGGYVDSSVTLEPATAINTGAVSVAPTFNNDQFNDQLLVSAVNNDPIRTPSTVDPVSTVTGNNYHDETDIRIKGRNGLDYVFTRTYNSSPTATGLDRGLGSGWTHSYGMRLKSNDFGICPNCDSTQKPENANNLTSSITYTDERGGEQNFLVNETTFTITNPKGVFDTLTLDSPVTGQHTLSFRNGVKYIFEVPSGDIKTVPGLKARLRYIDNPLGDRLILTYDAQNRLATVTDNLGIAGRTGLVFSYYSTNRIQSINDWTGRYWLFGYTGSDLTIKVDPLNQAINYTYQPGHLLHEIIQPLQRNGQTVKTTFNYYQNGRMFNYHNTLGHTETLSYDLYRKSTRVTDPRGGVREYNYDINGRMTKLTEPDGGVLIFENQNGDGIRNKKYDALGYATSYSYRSDRGFGSASDTGGNVSRERDALNHDIDTDYGIYDQITVIKDKNGHNQRAVYATTTTATEALCGDVKGKRKETRADLNGQTDVLLASYTYDTFGNPCVTKEYIEAGNPNRFRETLWAFDPNNLYPAFKIVNQSDDTNKPFLYVLYSYDDLGRQRSENLYHPDPNDPTVVFQATSYQYDALDRVIKTTDPEGRIYETVYDANGQVYLERVWHKQPNNLYTIDVVANNQYDAADRRIATTDVLGHTSQLAYDPAGNLTKVTDANGHVAQYEYDAMNRKTATIDGNGHRTETRYNLRGEAIAVTNANGETVKSEYDEIGRLSKVVDALGFETQYRYDANGNQTCRIDANALSNAGDPGHQPVNADGCTESRQYDELNRLIQSKDAENHVTAYSYDLFGNRTSVTDAEGRITTFHYDDLGRLIEIVDPLIETPVDKTQTFAHDEAGNVIEAIDRKGQTTQYAYDRLNRLRQADHLADSSQETYTYDIFGDLIQSQNADVTYTYTYSSKHQLQSKTDSRASKTLSWTYDPAGNIDTKTDYQGDITTYQYDSANRLVAETNPAYLQVSYHYDGAGRLIDRILSNGAITHYGWDAASRLTQLKNTTLPGGLVNDTGYTRDRLGNILSQTETNALGQVTGTTTYTYDPEYRLLTADYPGTAFDESFSYDKVGNRKTHTLNGSSQYYNVDAGNRLQDIRTGSPTGSVVESYQYDDNGNLTSISGNRSLTLTWDANNRVKQINSTQYRYDPKGYRIEKTGSLTNRYYLEGEHLEAVYDGNGALRDQYLRGTVIDEVVNGYHRDANNVMVNSTYHHDALQSVLGQSAHDGQLQSTQSYTAFGGNLSSTGTSNAVQKYTGREQDSESGFFYYRARYYDPIRGGFISVDPLGFKAGVNFYVYVNNNPVNANDPSGNICVGCMVLALANTPVGQALSNPAYYQLLGDHAGQFANGAISYPRGIVRAVDYGTQLMGLQGDALQSRSQVNLQILNTLTNQAIQNPDVALNFATDYAAQNVSQVAGRFYAGIGTGLLFPNTYQGKLTSLGLSGTAMFGDAMNAINNGVNTLQGLIPPVLGAPVTPSINFNLNIQTSSSNSLSNTISNYLGGNFANGGFVLYPNKSNTNMMAQVYKK